MMYRCKNCGEIFDEPRVFREGHGFNDGFYETFSCCPNCGGDYVEITDEEEDVDE